MPPITAHRRFRGDHTNGTRFKTKYDLGWMFRTHSVPQKIPTRGKTTGMNEQISSTPKERPSRGIMGRRSVLLGSIFSGVSITLGTLLPVRERALAAAIAAPGDRAFLEISRAITGHSDLDPVISARLCSAMQATFPGYTDTIRALSSLIASGGEPKDILERSGDLRGAVLALNAAWYTGSVEDKTNAPMVTYYNALMYQPTRDGLPVPTYCFNRPGWWTEDPPELGIPVRAPAPATPPAPVPQGVVGKTPSQTPPLKPIKPTSAPHLPQPTQEH